MLAPLIRNKDFFTIKFKHLPTKATTTFQGWVTTFSDNFSSQWNEVPVYGRMDPLSTFTRTSRKIQLAFDVVSDSGAMAEKNLQRVNKLITFLYPLYDKQDGTDGQRVGHTLKAAPLIELKWTNLIADPSDDTGLIGYLDGVNYAPKIVDGGFGRAGGGNFQETVVQVPGVGAQIGTLMSQNYATRAEAAYRASATPTTHIDDVQSTLGSVDKSNIYIPKTLSISLSFTVLHKHLPGWVQGTNANEYIFGNRQVNGGFPNTQKGLRVAAALMEYMTDARLDDDGNFIARTVTTEIVSSFGTQILQGNGDN